MSFKSIYYSSFLREKRKNNSLEPETKQILQETLAVIRKNKLHRSKQTDLVLSVYDTGGLKAIVSDKEQGTPHNPGAVLSLSKYKSNAQREEELLDFFKDWEYAFSPEGLAELEAFKKTMAKSLTEYFKQEVVKPEIFA